MVWMVLNLLLSIFEAGIVWTGIFYFMKANKQSIFLGKCWYCISFLLAGIIYYILSILFPNRWICIVWQLGMTVVIGFGLFHRKILPLILDVLYSVMLFLGLECGIFIFNIILAHIGIGFFPNPACIGCAVMGIKILILLPLSASMIKWKKLHSDGQLALWQTITILILPAFSIFFLYSLMQMALVYMQLFGIWLLLGNIIALLLLNIYFLYLFRFLFRANRLEQEMKLMQIQNELQYHHYEEVERKYQESRKILHDMKNHLQAVEQLYETKNMSAGNNYVKDLYHMINILGEKYYSSNHMLNIILNEKLSQAQRMGIQVKAEIGDVDFDDLKDIDITTIFSNLLDNAIEAASFVLVHGTKAPFPDTPSASVYDAETPWLTVKIDNIQDFRVIRISNFKSPQQPPLPYNRKKKHMGLGLANVRQALGNYHGTLEQGETAKEYQINIMIPKGDKL